MPLSQSMRLRAPGATALFVTAATALGVGVLAGGSLGGAVGPSHATDELSDGCEYNRCSEGRRGCEYSGEQATDCRLHQFGCGTIPCGLDLETLSMFPTDEATEIWLGFGPAAIIPLATYASNRQAYPHRPAALRTLAKMAQEWDVGELDPDLRDTLFEVAVQYTRRPLDHVALERRVASMLRGIDLAVALDHPYHDESVRLLEDPDTVRSRLNDGRLDPLPIVAHARRVR